MSDINNRITILVISLFNISNGTRRDESKWVIDIKLTSLSQKDPTHKKGFIFFFFNEI
jgi:hypothetical protein